MSENNCAELLFDNRKIKSVNANGRGRSTLSVSLATLEKRYVADGGLTYLATLVNTSCSTLKEVRMTSDLGAQEGNKPLVFCKETALYVNGEYSGEVPSCSDGKSVTFTIASLGTDDNVLVVYKTKLSAYASLEPGSVITSRVSVAARGICQPSVAEIETQVGDFTDVVMFKTETRNGKQAANTYTLYNYGNTEASDAVLIDTFSPLLYITSVETGGEKIPASDYTYVDGTVRLPSAGHKLSVPVARFSRSPSGEVVTIPGSKEIIIKGTL